MDEIVPAWIGVDWGTTALRAWAFDVDDGVLAEATSDKGMGALEPGQFEDALLETVGPWLAHVGTVPMPVVASGMVGARQGWREAPYRSVPCPPLTSPLMSVMANDARIAVAIVPGLAQASPADVMRGEETQIAGVLAGDPDFDGVICLPGTHTKWARVSGGQVVHFKSCMTGELFALIGGRSVLRHSVETDGFDTAAFCAAVDAMLADPQDFAGRLFAIRAEGLLTGLAQESARARLSGLLIGAELAATRASWQAGQVAIVGAGNLGRLYAEALGRTGVAARITDATAITLDGLRAAHSLMQSGASS